MALPAAWTEATLTTAVEAELEPVTAGLGLDTLNVVATAVGTDVPSVLKVASVNTMAYASIADVVKVLRIAQWVAWQKAYDAAVLRMDVKAGSAQVWTSQQWEHLKERLGIAYGLASSYPEVIALVGGAIPVPYAGGLSKSDKQGREANTDRVVPFFTRDLHEPAGARSETG